MKACTLVVAARSGTGTQTVTGVVDRFGVPFTPKAFIVHGNGVADTDSTYAHVSWGFDDGTTPLGQSFDEVWQSSAKIVSTNSGNQSILNAGGNIFFGGDIFREASVSAVASGEFTLNYTVNTNTGDSFIVTCLGGDDLEAVVAPSFSSNVCTTGFPVEAVFTQNQSSTAAVATAGGGGGGFGWATKTSGMGAAAIAIVPQGGNAHYQITTEAAASLDQTTLGNVSQERTITDFGSSSFTVSDSPSVGSFAYLAVGGSIVAKAGRLTQPTTAGDQEVLTDGIVPRLVLLMSVGNTASTSVSTSGALWSFGSSDGTRQASYWTGETVVGNTTLAGARYLSSSKAIIFATPNGSSTTLHSTAEMRPFRDDTPSFTLHWNVVDGTARDVLWIALGEPPSAPTYHTVSLTERRLRQAPHIVSELHRQFISKFQIHLQPGIGQGTGQGADPMVMFQYSKDGGHTWSNERLLPAGKVGQYARRCIAWRLGVGRDWVFRVSVTDPNVPWALVAAYLDGSEGVN